MSSHEPATKGSSVNPYINPLNSDEHPLHNEYREARALQSDGSYSEAVQAWDQLIELCILGAREELEAWRQLPVCWRLQGDLERAESAFQAVHDSAVAAGYYDMAMRIAWDWSALYLERDEIGKATDLLESYEAKVWGDDWLMLQGYLGRAYGRRVDTVSRRSEKGYWRQHARAYMRRSWQGLRKPSQADFRLDVLLWAIELTPWWSPYCQPLVWRAAWQALKMWRPKRLFLDLPVTFFTDYHGRNKARRWLSRRRK